MPCVFHVQSRPGQGREGVIYLLISIMHFCLSDNVKMKICSDLAEKDLSVSKKLFVVDINPNQAGGGQICPTDFQTLIPQEPKVGLTSNQAVNSSLSRGLNKLNNSDQERTLVGPFSARATKDTLIGI